MKPASIALVLILLLALLAPVVVRADIDGFKGMRWGSNLADLQQTKKLVLAKAGGKSGLSLYALENEALRFGKATLTGIHCAFAKERLQGVILLFNGTRNFAAVRTEAFAKFGEISKIDQNNEEMYNWPGTTTNIILSYNRGNQSGFLFMKAKKMPPQIKTAMKRNPAAPGKQKTTASTDDLETAIDQAPPLLQQPGNSQNITPKMRALLAQDQKLTQLCWEKEGPAADAACAQMQKNVERLEQLGLCMRSGPSGASLATAVIWQRCESTTTDDSSALPSAKAPEPDPIPAQQTTPRQAGANTPAHCRQIGELFASAGQMRNNGVEPQIAEQELVWQVNSQTPGITIEQLREVIELVYFDQEYKLISGDALIQRVSDRCQSGRGPFLHPTPSSHEIKTKKAIQEHR